MSVKFNLTDTAMKSMILFAMRQKESILSLPNTKARYFVTVAKTH